MQALVLGQTVNPCKYNKAKQLALQHAKRKRTRGLGKRLNPESTDQIVIEESQRG